VARRRRATARVGVQHRVTKEDAIKWYVTGRQADRVCKSARWNCFANYEDDC
jgi:hypothetical protein